MMKIYRRRLTNKSGFTLLEILIAMTIMSIITLIVGSVFRLGVNSWDKGEAETGETQKLRILSGLLSQQIKSAYPYKMLIDEDQTTIFKGESDSLMFVTTLAEPVYAGFKWVRYFYEDGVLYYKEGRLPDKEFHNKMSGDEEVLDPEIGEVTFSYYLSSEEEWVDEWDEEEGFPDAVRVRIDPFESFMVTTPEAR
jgi:general secretion pathway protein J